MAHFRISKPDEETIEFYIDGKFIGEATYDDCGWSGMEKVERLFVSIATHLNEEVDIEE
jgi:hypothetical protein